jgi:peptidoglycan/LPS O-acetylase OafA/YrhL
MRAAGYFRFEARPGENGWLDLVRALAIALVLVRHGYRASDATQAAAPAFLHALGMNGWVGVDLFFVLSGYLISRHLVRSGLGSGGFVLWRYLAARALRIGPAYVAALALVAASVFPFYAVDPRHLGARVAYHLLFLQDYLGPNINIVFWSLGVEEKFYLFAPVLVGALLVERTLARRLLIALLVAALSPAMRALTYYFVVSPTEYLPFFLTFRSPFHTCLEPFMAGVAIAIAQEAGVVKPSRTGRWLLGLALLVLFAWLASHEFIGPIGPFDAVWQPAVIAALCGLVTLAAVRLNGVPMPLAAGPRVVARLSYALYLMHYPLVPLAMAASRNSPYPIGAFWLVYLVAAFAAAALLHWAVEKPFLLVKSKILRDERPRAPPQAAYAH